MTDWRTPGAPLVDRGTPPFRVDMQANRWPNEYTHVLPANEMFRITATVNGSKLPLGTRRVRRASLEPMTCLAMAGRLPRKGRGIAGVAYFLGHSRLVEQGWNDFFLDLDPQRGLKAGQRWQEALKQAAERCEVVMRRPFGSYAKKRRNQSSTCSGASSLT
jgi:hypothetical protein